MSRVCVVDHDATVLRLLGRALCDGGLDVDLLDQGARVLDHARSRGYDLVLLDGDLPDVDGIDLLRDLRAADPYAQIMVLSVRDDCATRVRCLDLGACDFVARPFDLPELLARVRVRLRPVGRPPYLQRGDAQLDLVRHAVVLQDRTVSLPAREFLLLNYLMSRAGEVCPREELMAAVWQYDFKADANVVDVYVSRLRKKIPGWMIRTIREVGYSFVAA